MLPPLKAFANPKEILRERMKGERKAAAKKRPDAAVHAARNFLAAIDPDPSSVVALYFPIKHELDTEPLAAELVSREIAIALPVVEAKNAPLIFRAYQPGDALISGAYGAMTPSPRADLVTPAIIVTPLLAFTRKGDRLGYGGGFYDRTLSLLRAQGPAIAVGFAFAAQEVDALPPDPLDQRLDWIVTEREAIRP